MGTQNSDAEARRRAGWPAPHLHGTGAAFRDREDAGQQLAAALRRYERTGALVLGIARGGAEVGYEVARALDSDFSIIVIRKLPFPNNPEAGFGAVAEDGTLYFAPAVSRDIPKHMVSRIVREQRAETARRVKELRGDRPLPDLRFRHVILVDDGIAMGSTTRVAVECCRHLGAQRVTVAAPVASPHALAAVRAVADEVEVVVAPPLFRAVAESYLRWRDVTDEEVLAILAKADRAGLPGRTAPAKRP